MSKSLNCLYYHVVWSTKHRKPCINQLMDLTIKKLARQKARDFGIYVLAGGNSDDHVHLLVKFPPGVPITRAVGAIKGFISRRIKEIYPRCSLYWQRGYAAFTISEKHIATVCHYVENQRWHHRREVRPREVRP